VGLIWAEHQQRHTTPLRALLLADARRTNHDAPPHVRPDTPAEAAVLVLCPDDNSPATDRHNANRTCHCSRRWSLLPTIESDATVRSYAMAEVLLDRYGIVTRGSVLQRGFGRFRRGLPGAGRAEESGRVRRGYFVEGLGAAQFATTGAVDRLRAQSRPLPDGLEPSVTNARTAHHQRSSSPPRTGQSYGAALGWPTRVTDLSGEPEVPELRP